MRLSGPFLRSGASRLGPLTSMGVAALVGLAAASTIASCTIYSTDLLQPTGSGGSAASNSTHASTGEGGAAACKSPDQCPGSDTACGTRTCVDGSCGVDPQPEGTALPDPQPGDCKKAICDGSGDATTDADPTDVPSDGKQCTDDSCNGDQPVFANTAPGTGCTEGGGKFCKDGACVECIDGGNCTSGICTQQNTCAPATCDDGMLNGGESDTDCGGSCDKCPNTSLCNGPSDCISDVCTAGHCAPSCTDGLQNQGESDTDCGGGVCPACAMGLDCDLAEDCETGVCNGSGQCGEYALKISEARFTGANGGTDDFFELYNPTPVDVVLTPDIVVQARAATAGSYGTKFTGANELLPAHGHILIAGGGYSGSVAPDHQLGVGTGLLADKPSVVLKHGTVVLDALCLYCGANPFDAGFTCEGTPVAMPTCTTTVDRSAERKPGGAAGNGTDTDDNVADFVISSPSNPQNLSSPPTP